MKNLLLVSFAVLAMGLAGSGCKKPAAQGPAGFWKGPVEVNGSKLLIYLKINKEPDGHLTGSALNLALGAKEMPMTTILYTKPSVLLMMRGRLFRGNLINGGKQMSGRWEQNGKSLPIVFERTDKLPATEQRQDVKKVAAPPTRGPNPDLQGIWKGTLELNQLKLRLVLKMDKNADGTLTATLDSPDQGAADIPVTAILFNKPSVRLELDSVGGLYDGKMNENASEILGNWSQGGRSTPLTFQRSNSRDKAPKPVKLLYNLLKGDAPDVRGFWKGTLEVNGTKLRIALKIGKAAYGSFAGTMTSLDQGGTETPMSSVIFPAPTLLFELQGIGAAYRGDLAKDAKQISGTWEQGAVSLPLIFDRAEKPVDPPGK